MNMTVMQSARGAIDGLMGVMGTEVTWRDITKSYNTQGDLVKTATTSTITVLLEPAAEMTAEGKFGRLIGGEMSMYCEYDIGIAIEDEIVVGSDTYQVQDELVGYAGGAVYKHFVIKRIA